MRVVRVQRRERVVRAALDRLRLELARQRLRESADLYAEVYDEDAETREVTDAASAAWPT